MKERPILFSGPMVRAIMDGQKTQTRRVVKPQPQDHHWDGIIPGYRLVKSGPHMNHDGRCFYNFWHEIPNNMQQDVSPFCPYGFRGGKLWVRETWQQVWFGHGPEIIYRADNSNWAMLGDAFGKWKPSIHMFRWMSRITLEITDIFVERVQDISDEDVLHEGFRMDNTAIFSLGYQGAFKQLWDSINGKTYPWSSNPWVWVVKFKRLPIEG